MIVVIRVVSHVGVPLMTIVMCIDVPFFGFEEGGYLFCIKLFTVVAPAAAAVLRFSA